jgi:hypothetical protein
MDFIIQVRIIVAYQKCQSILNVINILFDILSDLCFKLSAFYSTPTAHILSHRMVNVNYPSII